jgi:hypothetical protein
VLRSTAALVIRAGFLVVLVPLDVRGSYLVRAHEGHAARPSMRTTGAHEGRPTSSGSQWCLRSCMRAVVCCRCCSFCCTELTCRPRGSSAMPVTSTLSGVSESILSCFFGLLRSDASSLLTGRPIVAMRKRLKYAVGCHSRT